MHGTDRVVRRKKRNTPEYDEKPDIVCTFSSNFN